MYTSNIYTYIYIDIYVYRVRAWRVGSAMSHTMSSRSSLSMNLFVHSN